MVGLMILRNFGKPAYRMHLFGGLNLRQFLSPSTSADHWRSLHLSPRFRRIVSFHLSDIGEGIREVTIKEWYVKVGDVVEQFDNLCEVQSDKASVTITSRYDGKIMKLHHSVDNIAMVGKPLLDFDVQDNEEDKCDSNSSDDENDGLGYNSDGESRKILNAKILATPAVRRIAMENKVDLAKVSATGRNGRVLKGDVLEFLHMIPKGTVKPHFSLSNDVVNSHSHQNMESMVQSRKIEQAETTVPLNSVAKVMFKTMTESLKIPHFAYCDEVDITKLVVVRKELKEQASRNNIKLTYMPFFLKAVSNALLHFPILNSSYDELTQSIIYKTYHNISVAMQTHQGLVVPNIKHVEKKSILQIAEDLNALQDRGAKNAFTPNDFASGTFTLSNIGILGGTYTHPVVVVPQVAIGGIGKTRVLPRFDETGKVVQAHIMVVSWTADHRIIDGVTIASFSNMWKRYLENPNMLILGTN